METNERPSETTDIDIRANWFEFAICHGQSDLFFSPYRERPQTRARREAKAILICQQCPVSTECREYGRSNHEYGVWGGENEIERHQAGFSLPEIIGLRRKY